MKVRPMKRGGIWQLSGKFDRRRSRLLVCLIFLVVSTFLIWASNAPLDELTRGQGKVVPLSRGQIIQSLEGGILEHIEVYEGQEVAAGETLAIIDDTRARAAYEDLKGQSVALEATLDRLRAELAQADKIDFGQDVVGVTDIVTVEQELFAARRRHFKEGLASLQERKAIVKQELDLVRPLVKSGATGQVKQIELERGMADINGELTEFNNKYFQDVNEQISAKGAELASVTQQRVQRRDSLDQTILKSPVKGIVKNLEITTKGGVVQPGQKIMEIVPLEDRLYVEAEVRPQDVAFLHPGQPATVKITAYDYTIYGMLTGELVFISADTILDEKRKDPQPYYRIRVLTDSAALEGPDGLLPIKPGMVAEVNVQTGKKTVLEYLLKPILKATDAFHER
ncbi:HlyD family type I secretion periplasmic adaptor subunit [Ensifer sp. SL37]|uniref:HlyD family type I secretion periplasmic adaptor subunit n=1 Tax=Ensifer sp. SL37 TaxID=2995137 RepID=UPI00227685DA|nr:HlyD family type I secretion periplasmic adaptor subunit [Ensifer sp. SL37]MCY1740908.1 HlyD family type I secretion periplasmic adaptor subunit [Ensifer sp. SL37]